MKSRPLLAVLCAVGALAPTVAAGEGSWYGSLGVGWNYADRLHIDGTGGIIDFDFGLPAGSIALGTTAVENWRFELEASYQKNAPEVLFLKGTDIEFDTRHRDQLGNASFLLNAIREFEVGIGLRPYLGVGVGAAKTRLKFTTFENENGADDPLIDDSTWGFAYQLIAGLSIPLTRQLSMGLEYHYWQAPWLNLEDLAGNEIDGRQTVHSGWLRLSYQPGGRVWTLPGMDDRPVTASQGLYLSASAGAGWGVDRDLQGRNGQLDAFAVGSMSSFALGYGFGRHWRAELEFSRRQNEMQIFDTLYEEFRTTGDVRADSLALNLAYQFRPGTAINPYLGAGIGSARLHYELDFAGDRTPFVDDVDNAQMIQLLLGVDIALNGHWTLTTDYRLWVSEEVEVERLDSDETLKMSHATHSWAVGLRYTFAD